MSFSYQSLLIIQIKDEEKVCGEWRIFTKSNRIQQQCPNVWQKWTIMDGNKMIYTFKYKYTRTHPHIQVYAHTRTYIHVCICGIIYCHYAIIILMKLIFLIETKTGKVLHWQTRHTWPSNRKRKCNGHWIYRALKIFSLII